MGPRGKREQREGEGRAGQGDNRAIAARPQG